MPKDPDELGLQQAELVILLQKEEGEALHVHTAALLSIVPPECGPHVFCSSARVVLWGEDERWRTGLVSFQLCHRDHQPHRHRKQRRAHEAPAQRDQRLSQRPPSLRDWQEETQHLADGGPWAPRPEEPGQEKADAAESIFWL